MAGAGTNIDITGDGKTKAHSQIIQQPLLWIHKAYFDNLNIITQGYCTRNLL